MEIYLKRIFALFTNTRSLFLVCQKNVLGLGSRFAQINVIEYSRNSEMGRKLVF